jgi:hypothetical protein
MKWILIEVSEKRFSFVNLANISRVDVKKYESNYEVKFYTIDENYFILYMNSEQWGEMMKVFS